jgi:saccharopine dehydrogenase-like NADP-dependent oxidoreductase
VECVNVEHEEVVLVPRWVDCRRVTFKYGLGEEFIDVLRTLHKLGLDSTVPLDVRGVRWPRATWWPPRCPIPRASATA